MNFLSHRQKTRDHVLQMPEGLQELMSDISREVLRCQPSIDCTYKFIADYLEAMVITRDKCKIAMEVIDDAILKTDEVYSQFAKCNIPKDKTNSFLDIMEITFRRFVDQKRQRNQDPRFIKFHADDMLEELMRKCDLSKVEVLRSRPAIQWAYRKFVKSYLRAIEGTLDTEDLYLNTDKLVASRKELNLMHGKAVQIQKVYRGYHTRKNLQENQQQQLQDQVSEDSSLTSSFKNIFLGRQDEVTQAAIKIQSSFKGYFARKKNELEKKKVRLVRPDHKPRLGRFQSRKDKLERNENETTLTERSDLSSRSVTDITQSRKLSGSRSPVENSNQILQESQRGLGISSDDPETQDVHEKKKVSLILSGHMLSAANESLFRIPNSQKDNLEGNEKETILTERSALSPTKHETDKVQSRELSGSHSPVVNSQILQEPQGGLGISTDILSDHKLPATNESLLRNPNSQKDKLERNENETSLTERSELSPTRHETDKVQSRELSGSHSPVVNSQILPQEVLGISTDVLSDHKLSTANESLLRSPNSPKDNLERNEKKTILTERSALSPTRHETDNQSRKLSGSHSPVVNTQILQEPQEVLGISADNPEIQNVLEKKKGSLLVLSDRKLSATNESLLRSPDMQNDKLERNEKETNFTERSELYPERHETDITESRKLSGSRSPVEYSTQIMQEPQGGLGISTDDPDNLNEAAAKIQATYKGYRVRKDLSNKTEEGESKALEQQSNFNSEALKHLEV